METWAIIVGIAVILWSIGKIFAYSFNKKNRLMQKLLDAKECELKEKSHTLDKKENDLQFGQAKLEEKSKQNEADKEAIKILAKEKSLGFPWLSQAYADYFLLQDMKRATFLEKKSHPAKKASDHLRDIAFQRSLAEKLYRAMKYQLEYYENLFPWLIDFKSEDIDDFIKQIIEKKASGSSPPEASDDPVKTWLTEAEYIRLSQTEKNQLALDRFWQKKKSKWEIGRHYERFNGYLYEKQGYSVHYQGIIEGLNDLGRDLIATKGDAIEIIQCKCWSREKQIHEKHVFQLFGTAMEYWLNRSSHQEITPNLPFVELFEKDKLTATLITSTRLSERARQFAKVLNIRIIENRALEQYPSIKCNLSRRSNEKIYHLPFDQQYDRTLVEEERNERYVETVGEAEKLGYRRAWKWRDH